MSFDYGVFNDVLGQDLNDDNERDNSSNSLYSIIKAAKLDSNELKNSAGSIFFGVRPAALWTFVPVLDPGICPITEGLGRTNRIGQQVRLKGLELTFLVRLVSGISLDIHTTRFVVVAGEKQDFTANFSLATANKVFNSNDIYGTRNSTFIDKIKIIHEFHNVFNYTTVGDTVNSPGFKRVYLDLKNFKLRFKASTSEFNNLENLVLAVGMVCPSGSGASPQVFCQGNVLFYDT